MNILENPLLYFSLIVIFSIFSYHLVKLRKLYLNEKQDIDTLANLVKKINLDTVSTTHHSISEELEEKQLDEFRARYTALARLARARQAAGDTDTDTPEP